MNIEELKKVILEKNEEIARSILERDSLTEELAKLYKKEEEKRLDAPVSLRDLLEFKKNIVESTNYSQQGLPMTVYIPGEVSNEQIEHMNNIVLANHMRDVKPNTSNNPLAI